MEIQHLEPKEIWKNFYALNQVPRPSKKEAQVTRFIIDFAQKLNLEHKTDDVGNVLILKPCTTGMENRETVVLQSHLDMVCQKNNEVIFDFETQPIQMEVRNGFVFAKGTTLGADNGMGVAAMMALLESKDIPHPSLECLFTIDEETGMTGAKVLRDDWLTGKIMLNLDTEEDDEIDIGCAGGIDVSVNGEMAAEEILKDAKIYKIRVKGLRGGHSGMDIDKNFGNANVLLTRFLYAIKPLQIIRIQGGGLRNAIPREAEVEFALSPSSNDIDTIFQNTKKDILEEFSNTEPNLQIDLEQVEFPSKGISVNDSLRVILALTSAHNGVFRMSPDVPNLVEASNNIAQVKLGYNENSGTFSFAVNSLSRSSVESTKKQVVQQLTAAFESNQFNVETSGDYPGWKPVPSAEIILVMRTIYISLFTDEARVVACHAGLECGIIGAKYPEMEMVSFGPNIRGAHSPEECVEIASVQKFWKFLQEILKNIPVRN